HEQLVPTGGRRDAKRKRDVRAKALSERKLAQNRKLPPSLSGSFPLNKNCDLPLHATWTTTCIIPIGEKLSLFDGGKLRMISLQQMRLEAPVEDLLAELESVRNTSHGVWYSRIMTHRKKDGTDFDVQVRRRRIQFSGRSALLCSGEDVTDHVGVSKKLSVVTP